MYARRTRRLGNFFRTSRIALLIAGRYSPNDYLQVSPLCQLTASPEINMAENKVNAEVASAREAMEGEVEFVVLRIILI